MTAERLQDVVSFLSYTAEYLFDGHLDADAKRQRAELIKEMTNLAIKSGELDGSEMIRFEYAKYKLDAILECGFFGHISISLKTDELFSEEIEQFHEVIRLGKKYSRINIKLPECISDESVIQLKSAFAEIKNRPRLFIRNSIPISLVNSLIAFNSISIAFTDDEVAKSTLVNLNSSNSILDLPYMDLHFLFHHCDQRFDQIPILVAALFGKLGIDVSNPFFLSF